MIAPSTPFLHKKIVFFVLLSVLATTVFSWFRVNSYCIILLVACRLFYDGKPLAAIRSAFGNPLFKAYFAFFLVETAGLVHTHNMNEGLDLVSKDSTLVAIAFVICAGEFAGEVEYRRMANAYVMIVVLASVYCLAYAFREYTLGGDRSVFFYHSLTRPISQNAVFYSVFVLFGLFFLLFPADGFYGSGSTSRSGKGIRLFLVIFFVLMIVLLNSKLMLVITLSAVLYFFARKSSLRTNKLAVIVAALIVVLGFAVFMLTDNPVRKRYQELTYSNLEMIKNERFTPDLYFNALQLRLLEWRFAVEILDENRAWVFGVSPGDSQGLLDKKYIATHMYIGNPGEGPHRKVRGFIGYNFHNQFLETFVRDGLPGLLALLAIFVLLARLVRENRSPGAFVILLTLVLFFIPEAPLTMQHGIFLFCFFPLLAPYSRKNTELPRKLNFSEIVPGNEYADQ